MEDQCHPIEQAEKVEIPGRKEEEMETIDKGGKTEEEQRGRKPKDSERVQPITAESLCASPLYQA